MKIKIRLILPAILLLLLLGCRNTPEKEKQKAVELLSTKSLGLGYLEEFKLDEAEKAFLKFIKLAPKEKLGYANLGLTYLRMGKYPEAEKQLQKAIKIDAKDPDIRLILSTVYQMSDKRDKAISELKQALEFTPDHIKTLYALTELYAAGSDTSSANKRKFYLSQLTEKAQGNLVPHLSLTDIFIRDGESDKALEQLEIIKKQFPEFPKEASEYYVKALSLLRSGDKTNAIIQFTIFHNYLKVTAPYQEGIMDLKGPGGSLIGFPVISFSQPGSQANKNEEISFTAIRFTDATSAAGLDEVKTAEEGINMPSGNFSHVETADYDGDGDIDLYAGSWDPVSSTYKHYLFNNEMGRFTDVAEESGIRHTGKETSAIFADFDNDGFPDLFITRENGDLLYRNVSKGKFEDITTRSKAGSPTGGKKAICFDADQDGDLDIFELKSGGNLLFRNNGDGTFTEQAEKMGLKGNNPNSTDAAFGDFDEDGDLDLVVTDESQGITLYSNQREGVFKDVTEQSGLKSKFGATSVTVGDYNNDGFLDIFVTSSQGEGYALYRNRRDGTFEKDTSSPAMFELLKNIKGTDAAFFDFDNDGYLDLIVTGEPDKNNGRSLFLFRNDGKGKFTNVSNLLPEEPKWGRKLTIFDYNDDGDPDILVTGLNGGITLLRNDGGNNNHYIKMKLVGLRTGSAKNNFFGIGAKVELRAGDLYQTMVVKDPNILFGLGNRTKADIIRITWTNGVPQNIFLPGSDQSLIESQVLKGSCPFIYTWNGKEFEFVKDILWRSALGMPMGIMGGTKTYAFPDASDDYLKISDESLKPLDNKYQVKVTSELWETIYLDKIQLVAVDHPDSSDVWVAEQFSPPPFPGMKIFVSGIRHFPVSAKDADGKDLLQYIMEKDDKYISDFNAGKYQGITEMHDLILDPGNVDIKGKLFLFMNGWVFPTDASINVAISQSVETKVTPPLIQVINEKGEWETVIVNAGFPMGKNKTVIIDLSGKIRSADHRVRIRTNMEIYWDQIFFCDRLSDAPVVTTVLDPVFADLHYRGFSKSFRKGGRYGPHWFDYSTVSTEPAWRDLTGNYTRYGDVLGLLLNADSKYIISNAGDETSIAFDAKGLPPIPAGWKRDFLVHSVGWVKDGDLNTATGKTVMPLPFHGMKSYPPDAKDTYPSDPDHQKYLREYNTRIVTGERYLDAVKGYNR
ncbi:MAG: FG-GAP-like repeat-containing protein [Bacteroidales bacterium]|jgi:tetratricopeptide (TPR) repeat protein